MVPLFELGLFDLRSGIRAAWRINAESLGPSSLDTIAYLISTKVGPFGIVLGVPRGGVPIARHLKRYESMDSPVLLIVDDVLTTGGAMEEFRAGREAKGCVIFDRSQEVQTPDWIQALWRLA